MVQTVSNEFCEEVRTIIEARREFVRLDVSNVRAWNTKTMYRYRKGASSGIALEPLKSIGNLWVLAKDIDLARLVDIEHRFSPAPPESSGGGRNNRLLPIPGFNSEAAYAFKPKTVGEATRIIQQVLAH